MLRSRRRAAGARMIVSRALPGTKLVSVLVGSAETRLDEGLERDGLGVDAGQDSSRSPTEAAARAAVIVGNGLARSPSGLVGSVTKDAGPTKTPWTLFGLKTANLMTMSPPAGVLPAMSRMALPPLPTRVS